MKNRLVLPVVLVMFGAVVLVAATATAADKPEQDVNVLIKALTERLEAPDKKISNLETKLTDEALQAARHEEIAKIMSEMRADASKRDPLPQWLDNLTFFGDLRLRYEHRASDGIQLRERNRYRFRLRFGFIKSWLDDQMKVGFRLASGDEPAIKSSNAPIQLESLCDEANNEALGCTDITILPPGPIADRIENALSDREDRPVITMAEFADTAEKGNSVPAAKAEGWEKPIPVGFYLDYTLATDYIWRGINLSEYRGEGREKLNHMLTAGANYDAGDFGKFAFSVWFEWYGANDRISGVSSDSSLQEVDYTFSWTYDLSKLCQKVPVELSLGWIGYDFPQLSDDGGFTNEYFIGLALDDQKLFGENWFSLNPTLTYYQDIDDVGAAGQGSWLEFGISHKFEMANCPGVKQVPFIKDLTVTPSFTLTMDIGYLGAGTRVATNQYGLKVGYDLGKALSLPERYGSLAVTGFLNYSDAVTDGATNFGANLNDEFWGGVSVGWEW